MAYWHSWALDWSVSEQISPFLSARSHKIYRCLLAEGSAAAGPQSYQEYKNQHSTTNASSSAVFQKPNNSGKDDSSSTLSSTHSNKHKQDKTKGGKHKRGRPSLGSYLSERSKNRNQSEYEAQEDHRTGRQAQTCTNDSECYCCTQCGQCATRSNCMCTQTSLQGVLQASQQHLSLLRARSVDRSSQPQGQLNLNNQVSVTQGTNRVIEVLTEDLETALVLLLQGSGLERLPVTLLTSLLWQCLDILTYSVNTYTSNRHHQQQLTQIEQENLLKTKEFSLVLPSLAVLFACQLALSNGFQRSSDRGSNQIRVSARDQANKILTILCSTRPSHHSIQNSPIPQSSGAQPIGMGLYECIQNLYKLELPLVVLQCLNAFMGSLMPYWNPEAMTPQPNCLCLTNKLTEKRKGSRRKDRHMSDREGVVAGRVHGDMFLHRQPQQPFEGFVQSLAMLLPWLATMLKSALVDSTPDAPSLELGQTHISLSLSLFTYMFYCL